MRPQYSRALFDIVRHYGWKRVHYVYDTEEGEQASTVKSGRCASKQDVKSSCSGLVKSFSVRIGGVTNHTQKTWVWGETAKTHMATTALPRTDVHRARESICLTRSPIKLTSLDFPCAVICGLQKQRRCFEIRLRVPFFECG